MKPANPRNFLLVDDHQVVLAGLKSLIQLDFPVAKFYSAQNGLQAIDVLKHHTIDILMTDVSMPEMDGYELIPILTKVHPELKIIIVTQFSGEAMTRFFLQHGVRAVISKSDTDSLGFVIKTVWEKGHYWTQDVIEKLPLFISDTSKLPLTAQNRMLISLIAEGKSSKVIAEILDLTENTVNSYRQTLLKQTHTRNTDELVAFAYENGLIQFKDFRQK